MKKNVLIYGANGYTGNLILEECLRRSMKPIIAGRSEKSIRPLAEKYNLKYHIFSLNNKAQIQHALETVKVMMHCAGPFRETAEPMVQACLETKTHYIDISGEMRVFKWMHSQDHAAKEAGIMLLPGAGFDVVPTDCLALYLKEKLPSATHLELAFQSGGRPSQGTMKTIFGRIHEGALHRRNGELIPIPLAKYTISLQWDEKEFTGASAPLGDLFSAYHSTGIPNIDTYLAVKKNFVPIMRMADKFSGIIKTKAAQTIIQKIISLRPEGPSEKERQKRKNRIWGRAWDDNGNREEARLLTSEGYSTTQRTATTIIAKVLNDNFKIGYQTPASAYGARLISEIDGFTFYDE